MAFSSGYATARKGECRRQNEEAKNGEASTRQPGSAGVSPASRFFILHSSFNLCSSFPTLDTPHSARIHFAMRLSDRSKIPPQAATAAPERWIYLAFFFVSGFCSLVYQVIWTRLAFASFGINTPVLSVVISVFMLGLSVGSWAGGRLIGPLTRRTGLSACIFYGLAEFAIGLGAFAVSRLFSLGERVLLSSHEANSFTYLSESALVLALCIL